MGRLGWLMTVHKKRVGRPRIAEERRDAIIMARVTPTMRDLALYMSNHDEKSLSSFIADLLVAEYQRRDTEK